MAVREDDCSDLWANCSSAITIKWILAQWLADAYIFLVATQRGRQLEVARHAAGRSNLSNRALQCGEAQANGRWC